MKPLLTKKQAAELVGVHPESIMRMARENRFPQPIRLGHALQSHIRFDEADVLEWLQERKAEVRDKPAQTDDQDVTLAEEVARRLPSPLCNAAPTGPET